MDTIYLNRQLEVKHGRIAMAATLGMLVQENYRFEGYLSPSAELKFTDVPNGLAALNVVPLLGWVQIAVVIGLHEFLVKERPGKAPGDFGTGYFGVALDDQSAKQLRLLVSFHFFMFARLCWGLSPTDFYLDGSSHSCFLGPLCVRMSKSVTGAWR